MKLLEHSAQGTSIQLDQRELLLVMALVQEGRESFGCNTHSGRVLDNLISFASRVFPGRNQRLTASTGRFLVAAKCH